MLYQTSNPHGGDVYGAPIVLDFSANINPYGTPEGVLNAIRDALPRLRQYPDPYCRELVRAIGAFEDLPEAYILCGNGAAELIYAYCEAARPARALELAPTFSEYALALERAGGTMLRYPLCQDREFRPDRGLLETLERERPEALFLCSPNNPTGQVLEPALLEEILKRTRQQGMRLFLDECFLDLADQGESLKPCLADNPQLLILKAFTKSYGMAGARLGYCLSADGELLRRMSAAVQPWNVSLLAQAAGVAALGEQAFLQRARDTVAREKRWLSEQLRGLGFWLCPSAANYLLFQAPVGLDTALRARQIAIRSCANYHGLGPGWYRIAVKLHEENERLIAAMAAVLQGGTI